MDSASLKIQLPEWVARFIDKRPLIFDTVEQRMALVIALSAENIKQGTGGPFAAAVFDGEGRLVSPGVNMVVNSCCSLLHAETVALALAQQRLGRFDISSGEGGYQLVSSTEPCAMCFGALLWAGVDSLMCGANKADAEAIGFDEGPKVNDWVEQLQLRGIEVQLEVLRTDAAAVLQQYAAQGQTIYNSEHHK